ncbi:MAG TPA: glycosyltransferase [Burkholderiaceae bacterium]|nr:glycosyltransferase [Burkholderiaceae bacterium]
MKVLFVINGLGLGGAERQAVLLTREMSRRGHGVCICTLNRHLPRVDELHGCSVEVVPDQKQRKLDLSLVCRLRRRIVTWKPDVVQGFLYDGDLYSRLAAVGLDVIVFSSERNHGYSISWPKRLALRITTPFCDGVVANTHAGAVFAQRLHWVPAERVHTVWNGIDLGEIDERLRRSERPAEALWPERPRVCIVGSFKPEKDHLLALRVARCILNIDERWRFLFVGDELHDRPSGYRTQLQAECERLGLQHAVKFLGHRRDVPELIASSDVLLVTSVYEGFPNVVLEAMACGTPVASTEYSDVRRILPMDWQVVTGRDERDLASIVQRCAREHATVAHAQRHWVETYATSAASCERVLQVYAAVARRKTDGLRKGLVS